MELTSVLLILLLCLAVVGGASYLLQSVWSSPSAAETSPVKVPIKEPAAASPDVHLPVAAKKSPLQHQVPDVFTDDSTEGSQGAAAVSPQRCAVVEETSGRVPELAAWPESTWASCISSEALNSAFLVVVGLVLDVSRRKNTGALSCRTARLSTAPNTVFPANHSEITSQMDL